MAGHGRGHGDRATPRRRGQGLAGVIVFLSLGSSRGTLIFMKHYFTRICLREKESHFKGLQL